MIDENEINPAALASMKEALAHPGRELSREETIEFITRHIDLGWPTPPTYNGNTEPRNRH